MLAGKRELSVFVDESGDLGAFQPHSPFYILSLVFHGQDHDISQSLRKIQDALRAKGFDSDHAIHTGPLIRREQDYRFLDLSERRAIFRLLFDFVRQSPISQNSLTYPKRRVGGGQPLLDLMAADLDKLMTGNHPYFQSWDRAVIYYDNGQKEIGGLVQSAFRRHVADVEFRKVSPSEYSLFQAADLCCTLALLREKINTPNLGLSKSERDFFSTPKASPERALRKTYFKPIDRKGLGA